MAVVAVVEATNTRCCYIVGPRAVFTADLQGPPSRKKLGLEGLFCVCVCVCVLFPFKILFSVELCSSVRGLAKVTPVASMHGRILLEKVYFCKTCFGVRWRNREGGRGGGGFLHTGRKPKCQQQCPDLLPVACMRGLLDAADMTR